MTATPGSSATVPPELGTERRLPCWVPAVCLLAILVVSCAVDLFFFTGYFASDDRQYFRGTMSLLNNGSLPAPIPKGQDRLVLASWNLAMAWLSGSNIQVVTGSYIVFHQLLIVLVFCLANQLSDWRVGLLAAYYIAAFPGTVLYASTTLPDIPLSCFFVLSLILFISSGNLRPRRLALSHFLIFLSGASIGCAYMCKQVGLYLLPFYFVAWLISQRRGTLRQGIASGLAFVGGLALVLLLETVTLSLLTGEFYFRLTGVAHRVSNDAKGTWGPWEQFPNGYYPLERLGWFAKRCLLPAMFPKSLQYLIAGSVLLYPLMPRRRFILLFLPLWFVSYSTWGTVSFSRYMPTALKYRYFLPAMPFLLVILAFVLASLYRLLSRTPCPAFLRRALLTVGVAFLIVYPVSWMEGPNARAGKSYRAELIRNVATAVRAASTDEPVPIFVAHDLYYSTEILLDTYKQDNVMSARQFPLRDMRSISQKGRVFYIQADQRRSRPPITAKTAPLDALMLFLLRPEANLDARKPPLSQARRYWSASPGFPDRVALGEYILELHKLGEFSAPRTRTEGLRAFMTARPIPAASRWRAVNLYTVGVRPLGAFAASQAGRTAIDLAPKLRRSGSVKQPKRLGQWNVWGGGSQYHVVSVGNERAAKLVVDQPGTRSLTLLHQQRDLPAFRLGPNGLYRIDLDVEVTGKAQVRFQLHTLPGPKAKPLQKKTAVLKSGAFTFGVCTEAQPAHLYPFFQMSGKGAFTLKRFAITCDSSLPSGRR